MKEHRREKKIGKVWHPICAIGRRWIKPSHQFVGQGISPCPTPFWDTPKILNLPPSMKEPAPHFNEPRLPSPEPRLDLSICASAQAQIQN